MATPAEATAQITETERITPVSKPSRMVLKFIRVSFFRAQAMMVARMASVAERATVNWKNARHTMRMISGTSRFQPCFRIFFAASIWLVSTPSRPLLAAITAPPAPPTIESTRQPASSSAVPFLPRPVDFLFASEG